MIRYTIYKNVVWREVIKDGVVMASRGVFKGRNRKECEAWISENK